MRRWHCLTGKVCSVSRHDPSWLKWDFQSAQCHSHESCNTATVSLGCQHTILQFTVLPQLNQAQTVNHLTVKLTTSVNCQLSLNASFATLFCNCSIVNTKKSCLLFDFYNFCTSGNRNEYFTVVYNLLT